MVSMKRSQTPGQSVANTIRFSQKDFRRGVDAMLTFKPLREAVSTLSKQAAGKTKGGEPSGKSGRDVTRAASGDYTTKPKR